MSITALPSIRDRKNAKVVHHHVAAIEARADKPVCCSDRRPADWRIILILRIVYRHLGPALIDYQRHHRFLPVLTPYLQLETLFKEMRQHRVQFVVGARTRGFYASAY